jgi:hypothetical protein
MGNCAPYYDPDNGPPPGKMACVHCNDTTRIIVGTYADGEPVTADCVCYSKTAKESPRG